MAHAYTRPIQIAGATMLVALGVLLRWGAVHNELWLDEIFSLELLSTLRSPWGIFQLSQDNNHYLNSLVLYYLGPHERPELYRLPALVCSILTLLAATWLCFRKGSLEGLFGSIIFSFSYVLILYGSEARGYSSMLLCCFLGLLFFERFRERSTLFNALLFWIVCIGGALSHFTFLQFYVALLIFTAVLMYRCQIKSIGAVLLHSVPAIFCAWLVGMRYFGMQIAGGPQGSRLEIYLNSLAVPYGSPELSPSNPEISLLASAIALCILAVLSSECIRLLRHKNAEGWFYTALLIAVPLILLLVFKPQVFVLRYILPSIAFSYIVAVTFLSRLYRRDSFGKVTSLVLLVLFILGNQRMILQLLQEGRGNYSAALKFIAANADSEIITIGGDQDFRNSVLVKYHSATAGLAGRFSYLAEAFPAPGTADWIILETQDQYFVPEPRIPESGLILAGAFGSAPLSGARWYIYCHEKACPAVLTLTDRH